MSKGAQRRGEWQGEWALDLFQIILLSLRLSWKFVFLLLVKTFKILLAVAFPSRRGSCVHTVLMQLFELCLALCSLGFYKKYFTMSLRLKFLEN